MLFIFGFIVLAVQPWMPLNPQRKGMLAPTAIFHTVVSFMTNTDVQHYSGDVHFSNFTQIILCLYDVFSFCVDWLLCPYDDHSGSTQ